MLLPNEGSNISIQKIIIHILSVKKWCKMAPLYKVRGGAASGANRAVAWSSRNQGKGLNT
jgi:hypothetical protein